MGVILWEDSIQQDLRDRKMYAGISVETVPVADSVVREFAQSGSHAEYASRQSSYWAHTRTGKKAEERPVVRNWRWGDAWDDEL